MSMTLRVMNPESFHKGPANACGSFYLKFPDMKVITFSLYDATRHIREILMRFAH